MELIVVGYGNMAKAILAGVLRQDKQRLGISKITIIGRNPHKIESWLHTYMHENHSAFAQDISLLTTHEVKCGGKLILLACKPHNLSHFIFHQQAYIVYSVLAGVNIERLQTHVQAQHYAIVMPNIGAMYAKSSSAVLWHNGTKAQTIKEAGKVLDMLVEDQSNKEIQNQHFIDVKDHIYNFVSSFGNCIFVETQKELNACIATNGSAPALLAIVAQALINAGIHEGLTLQTSTNLVQKTFEGIADLLKHKTPQEIKDSVTSPGGTTITALLHCDIHGVQGHITQASILAVKKAQNMQDNNTIKS